MSASAESDEFRDIPGFTWYQISRAGTIRNRRTGRITQPNAERYPTVNLVDEYGARTTRKVHRLVAVVWIPNPSHHDIVNHITGDTGNFHADNLEWVTLSENTIHALQTASCSEHTGIEIETLDPESGRCAERFPSIRDACRQHGIDRRTLRKHIDSGLPLEGYMWRAVPDIPPEDEEWGVLDEYMGVPFTHIEYSVSTHGRVRNNATKRILRQTLGTTGYPSISLTCGTRKKITVNVHRLVAYIHLVAPDNYRNLDVDHIDSDRTHNNFLNLQWLEKADHALKTSGRRVVQKDLTGVIIAIYASGVAAASALSETPKHISAAITGSSGKKSLKGYLWQHDTPETLNISVGATGNLPLRLQVNGKAVVQKNPDGGIVATYKTIVEAAKAIGGARENLGKTLNRQGKFHHGKYKGFLWAFADA